MTKIKYGCDDYCTALLFGAGIALVKYYSVVGPLLMEATIAIVFLAGCTKNRAQFYLRSVDWCEELVL